MPIISQMCDPSYPLRYAFNAILLVTKRVTLCFRNTERGGTFLSQQVGEAVRANVGNGKGDAARKLLTNR